MQVDFHFDVTHAVDGQVLPLRVSWHIDTNLYPEQPDRGVHSRFHLQFGGERLDGVDSDIRAVLLTEPPRLPRAPLEGLLAIDFVFSQYCGETWVLVQQGYFPYGRLKEKMIRRYWMPYYKQIAREIGNLPNQRDGKVAAPLIPSLRLN